MEVIVLVIYMCIYLVVGGYVEEILRPGGKCNTIDIVFWPALLLGDIGNKFRRWVKFRNKK